MMNKSPAFSILILGMVGLAVVSQLYVPVPLLQPIATQYDVPVTAAGLVLTVFGIAYASGFLVAGPLSDQVGRKAVMVPGLLATALATVLVALAPSFATLLGARAVQGFVAATLPPVALAYLAETLPEPRRALGIAVMSTAFLLAGLVGQLYGSAAGALTTAVLPLAGIYVIGALLVGLLPEQHNETKRSSGSLASAYRELPRLLKHGALVRGYLAALVLLFAFVAFYSALDLFAATAIAEAGLSLTTVRAAAVPAMLLPLITPRFIRAYGPRMIVRAGFALGAVGLFAAAAVAAGGTALWLLIAASIVFVAGVSISVPGLIALIGGQVPAQRGLAISLYTFVLFVGASLGPQLPPLVAALGFAGLCLILGGLFGAVAVLHTTPLRRAAAMPKYAGR